MDMFAKVQTLQLFVRVRAVIRLLGDESHTAMDSDASRLGVPSPGVRFINLPGYRYTEAVTV